MSALWVKNQRWRDFRLPPQIRWELRSSGLLRSEYSNFLTTFRYNLSVPSSGISSPMDSRMDFWPLKMGPTGCSETSLRNYDYSLCNSPEERSSQPMMTMTTCMTVTMNGQSTVLLETIIWSVSIGLDILPNLWNPEVHYRVHNSPLLHSSWTRLINCTDFLVSSSRCVG